MKYGKSPQITEIYIKHQSKGLPCGSAGKEFACNVGDLGLIPGLGRSPGGEHGNPLQYCCLKKPHGQRSLVGHSPWGCKELDTTERLSTEQHKYPLSQFSSCFPFSPSYNPGSTKPYNCPSSWLDYVKDIQSILPLEECNSSLLSLSSMNRRV